RNLPRSDMVIAHQAGEYGQARGVGRGPGRGAQRIAANVEHRAGSGGPASIGIGIRSKELVELPGSAIQYQHVPVAAGLSSALDRHVGWNGVGSWITFSGIGETERDLGLRGADSNE